MKEVMLYTDGSCLGNPGPGGWASILKYNDIEKVLSGGSSETTNNRMELTAAVEGLKVLKFPCKVILTTDSQYLVNAFNKQWIYSWKATNFKGRPNSDLWEILYELSTIHEITFKWVKGHAGHPFNERCDKEAQRQARIYSNT